MKKFFVLVFVLVLVLVGCHKTYDSKVQTPDGTVVASEYDDGYKHVRRQTVGGYGYGSYGVAAVGYGYDPRMSMPGYINAPPLALPEVPCVHLHDAQGEIVESICGPAAERVYVSTGRTFSPGETPYGSLVNQTNDNTEQIQALVDWARARERCAKLDTSQCRIEGGKSR